MKKIFLYVIAAIALLVIGFYFLNSYIYNEKQAYSAKDYKDAEYVVDGNRVRLINGKSEVEAAPGSSSKITTQYFGNEVKKDINNDGKEDVVFLLTQSSGGSGLFYYAVAALATENGYVGSQGLLLGDRIAPQTTESGPGNSVIINYADRKAGESMTTQPSVGKSIRLLLDVPSMQFGEVVQNFEGEADPKRMNLSMKKWVWINALYNDGRMLTPKKPGVFTITLTKEGTFSVVTDCNAVTGTYTSRENQIAFGQMASTKMYCEGSEESEFIKLLENTSSYHFTSKGELIFDLKFDSGNVVFR